MIRDIVRWPDPVLAQPCAPIEEVTKTVQTLAQDMLDTMYDAPGRGLAAPQIGISQRMFVMDVAWKDGPAEPVVCINPEITWRSETQVQSGEGCLSIPGLLVDVVRSAEVDLSWTDQNGVSHTSRFDGFASLCIQHETDHLDGIVTLDRVDAGTRDALIAEYEALSK
ncbi:MAG: peptide deformylase [Rhodobacteraceae bacterium]|nr:peptide deformylase [Paracoccaceae bacterium]